MYDHIPYYLSGFFDNLFRNSCMLRPFAHPVESCCLLLGVVPQSLKPVKRLSHCNSQNIFCSVIAEGQRNDVGSVCTALPILLGPRTRITHGPLGDSKSYGLYILPTMHCRSQYCWELLHPLLHTTLTLTLSFASTLNIVGPTMLGV